MNCFLKKLFGKKCDEKKSDDLANNPINEEIKETGSDQLSPDSEFSPEETKPDHQSDESTNEYKQ
jgi:hypothetical protein